MSSPALKHPPEDSNRGSDLCLLCHSLFQAASWRRKKGSQQKHYKGTRPCSAWKQLIEKVWEHWRALKLLPRQTSRSVCSVRQKVAVQRLKGFGSMPSKYLKSKCFKILNQKLKCLQTKSATKCANRKCVAVASSFCCTMVWKGHSMSHLLQRTCRRQQQPS